MRERVVGKIVAWDRRGFAFAQTGDGTRFFLGALELSRAGIRRLDVGQRVRFEIRLATARGPGTMGRQRRGAAVTTKSPDPLEALRRANQQQPPKREADKVPYNYYFSHPEHRPRKQPRRLLRRRVIREG
jgi:cold shock CspA family protein